MTEKACRTCGIVKPLTEYHRHSDFRDGRVIHCKTCLNAKLRGYVPKTKRSKPSPLKGVPKRPLAERFWEKVDKSAGPDGCWIWTASTDGSGGYGQIGIEGNKCKRAHAVAWELAGNVAPKKGSGLCLDHTCGNRLCVNVLHLRLVNYKQNALENNTSAWAKNAAKTHCIRGHEFTPDNILANAVGRNCRTCYEMRLRGELPTKARTPGLGAKLQALAIGETFTVPLDVDSCAIVTVGKRAGVRLTKRKINDKEREFTRVA